MSFTGTQALAVGGILGGALSTLGMAAVAGGWINLGAAACAIGNLVELGTCLFTLALRR